MANLKIFKFDLMVNGLIKGFSCPIFLGTRALQLQGVDSSLTSRTEADHWGAPVPHGPLNTPRSG